MIFLRPVDRRYPITQRFGENPKDYPNTNGHPGIDYGLPVGSPVYAAAAGVVKVVGLDAETVANPKAGYGYQVRIMHDPPEGGAKGGEGGLTIYGHLTPSSGVIHVGQGVMQGEVIGFSGNTGRSTGPHLHFEYRTFASNAINPEGMIVESAAELAGLFAGQVTQEGDGLRMRSGPGLDAGKIGNLKAGDIVHVLGLAGELAWLLCEIDGQLFYCAGRQDGRVYITRKGGPR